MYIYIYKYNVSLEEKCDKWTNVVIITCSVLNCPVWSQALYIASYSEGRCLEPWHEFRQFVITYNYKEDRCAHICLR